MERVNLSRRYCWDRCCRDDQTWTCISDIFSRYLSNLHREIRGAQSVVYRTILVSALLVQNIIYKQFTVTVNHVNLGKNLNATIVSITNI